jgi:hypothetical protein
MTRLPDPVPAPDPADLVPETAANFKTILAAELEETARTAAARDQFDREADMESHVAAGSAQLPFPARGRERLPDAAEAEDQRGSTIQQAGRRSLFGLALSGGGIRSATFNLGVLQGLAELKFLRRIHYLSTISGGGYIGSWLAAWIYRQGMKEVEQRLGARRADQPYFKEPPEVRFLREYSNYLTPRKGLFGADTWTVVAIYLRNLLLNQAILVLFIAAVLLAPRVVVTGALWSGTPHAFSPFGVAVLSLGIVALITIARSMATYNASPTADRVVARVTTDAKNTSQLKVHWLVAEEEKDSGRLLKRHGRIEVWDQNIVRRREVGHATRLSGFDWDAGTMDLDVQVAEVSKDDLVVAVYPWSAQQTGIFALAIVPIFLGISLLTWMLAQAQTSANDLSCWAAYGALAACVSWIIGVVIVRRHSIRKDQKLWPTVARVMWTLAACAISGAVGGILLQRTAMLLHGWVAASVAGKNPGAWNVMGFGTPLVTGVLLLYSVLQVGLLSTLMFETRREWWGRLEAWLLILCAGWAAAFGLSGYAPLLVLWLAQFPFSAWTAALGWAGSTVAGIMGAGSSKTSEIGSTVKDKLLGLTPYVFAIGLVVLVSCGVNKIISPAPETNGVAGNPEQVSVNMADNASGQVTVNVQAVVNKTKKPPLPREDYWKNFLASLNRKVLWAFLLCLAVSVVLAMCVDLTEFSMHYFYRNRLVRCYLGASHRERVPNPFTGFDEADDLFLADLVAEKGYDGPYPILGCALNLVHGKDLAWQERKAASFIMTPKYSGYDVWYEKLLRPGQWEKRGQASDGYRPTGQYAYPDGGFFLGTAMAISGAAASPNMGYHSSPALSFLMTVFNVRLGRWVGNPRDPRCWRKAGPAIGLGYLLAELFGAANDDRGYVYVSDGGHFENLGLYELVKRRCRFIIASDGADDKNFTFGDLASAIRKCRADMGIDIEIKTNKLLKVGDAKCSTWHCAVGVIKYSNSDPPVGRDKVQDGIVVYLKASLTNDEPADVLNYKAGHPDFPHQTTADQWFTESQFESYRALGQHIVRTLFNKASENHAGDLSRASLDDVFSKLQDEWRDPEQIQTNVGLQDNV